MRGSAYSLHRGLRLEHGCLSVVSYPWCLSTEFCPELSANQISVEIFVLDLSIDFIISVEISVQSIQFH